MEFTFKLVGSGWAEAAICVEDVTLHLTASYLGDALGDLLRAVVRIRDVAESASCTWEEEPGEYLWEFHRHDDQVHLRISGSEFWDNSLAEDAEDPRNRSLLDCWVSVTSLAASVARGAEGVLTQIGPERYRKN
ncbi:hypothetical protein [Curtobacterium sp. MCBD17_040]|uniref:hypothetical protein n=1 Tax=Curtobacterium sp. MCBD17_040 TaxID=2175674 RepID=UPI000DA793EC|nr:hypothetical protein [Curtobacterium sp. MCBD17_040]WIB65724.1 hypothetical protein DEI94_16515 [Curtobacterium sp. MCBD17_040]